MRGPSGVTKNRRAVTTKRKWDGCVRVRPSCNSPRWHRQWNNGLLARSCRHEKSFKWSTNGEFAGWPLVRTLLIIWMWPKVLGRRLGNLLENDQPRAMDALMPQDCTTRASRKSRGKSVGKASERARERRERRRAFTNISIRSIPRPLPITH